MGWLDRIPLFPLLIVALVLGLLPFTPPHLVQKLRMLRQGLPLRPIDVFDLVLHGGPAVLLLAKLVRIVYLWASEPGQL